MSAEDLALPLIAQLLGIFGAGFAAGGVLGAIVGAFTNLTGALDHL